jgi:hypothetical protein
MLHSVCIYTTLYKNLYSAWIMSSYVFACVQWKRKYNLKFTHAMKLPRSAIFFLDLHKNKNCIHLTPIIFGSTIKIGSWIQHTRVINHSHTWLGIYAHNWVVLRSNFKVFTLKIGDASTSVPRAAFRIV